MVGGEIQPKRIFGYCQSIPQRPIIIYSGRVQQGLQLCQPSFDGQKLSPLQNCIVRCGCELFTCWTKRMWCPAASRRGLRILHAWIHLDLGQSVRNLQVTLTFTSFTSLPHERPQSQIQGTANQNPCLKRLKRIVLWTCGVCRTSKC